MGILDKAKKLVNDLGEQYDKYQKEAPKREKAKLEKLKLQKERLKVESEISALNLQKKKNLEARFGFGSGSSMGQKISIGIEAPKEKPKTMKPKEMARKPKRRIIEEY